MDKTVLVPVADGIEEIETVTIVDTLRRCGAAVTVASVSGRNIKASRGVNLTADVMLSDCLENEYDLIALPGGMPGAEHLRNSKDLVGMLKAQNAAGRLYAAICASPAVVFQRHGLLDGKKATCFPSFLDLLEAPSGDKVVVDGNCITSQGPGTALSFALTLVEQLCGADKRREIAEQMLVSA